MNCKSRAPDRASVTAALILTAGDVRELLAGLAAAIELDQIRVNALPAERFHPVYSDDMWRRWRCDHLDVINQLLPTVALIPRALLQELSRVAGTYDPVVVREVMLDLFSEAALEGVESAEKLFGRLIKVANSTVPGKPLAGNAGALVMQWVRVPDPLRIADDPECCYGIPSGFVN